MPRLIVRRVQVQGLKIQHNISLDFLGIWNEKQ